MLSIRHKNGSTFNLRYFFLYINVETIKCENIKKEYNTNIMFVMKYCVIILCKCERKVSVVDFDIEKLIQKVQAKDHRINCDEDTHIIKITDEIFCLDSIFMLMEHIKFSNEKKFHNFNLEIMIETKYIADEATILMLEFVIYYLMKVDMCQVICTFAISDDVMGFGSLVLSHLFEYNTRFINRDKYISFCEKKLHINKNHYRIFCENTEENRKGIFLSKVLSDVTTFTSVFNIEKNYVDEIGEVVTEIIGNELEHTRNNCILDIKIIEDDSNKFKCMNVTTISFGDTLISTSIKDYIYKMDKSDYNNKNKIVMNAFENHCKQFTDFYDLDSFAMISAFQKYVTTRKMTEGSGGTGLTTLIKQLKEKTSKDYCYVLSGNGIILFKEPYLDLTNEGLIGFNEQNDYINSIPSREVCGKTQNRFDGTIYNLSFILEERNVVSE